MRRTTVLLALVRSVLGRVRRLRNARLSAREVWERSLPSELDYWTGWVERRGATGPERVTDSFAWRLDPGSEVEEPLRGVVARVDGATVSILDVGAGPLTSVGKVYPGKRLEIAAVDPLADEYARVLERAGIDPPVRTRPGEAEALLGQFEPESFDVAHADNALDHAPDPMRAIESMLAVVRPRGYVVLRHGCNEGERNHYRGLHQWNFALEGDDLVVWGNRSHHNVSRRLRPAAVVECVREGNDVVAVIGKHRG
jgi:SAM-dependent methyltransferase